MPIKPFFNHFTKNFLPYFWLPKLENKIRSAECDYKQVVIRKTTWFNTNKYYWNKANHSLQDTKAVSLASFLLDHEKEKDIKQLQRKEEEKKKDIEKKKEKINLLKSKQDEQKKMEDENPDLYDFDQQASEEKFIQTVTNIKSRKRKRPTTLKKGNEKKIKEETTKRKKALPKKKQIML